MATCTSKKDLPFEGALGKQLTTDLQLVDGDKVGARSWYTLTTLHWSGPLKSNCRWREEAFNVLYRPERLRPVTISDTLFKRSNIPETSSTWIIKQLPLLVNTKHDYKYTRLRCRCFGGRCRRAMLLPLLLLPFDTTSTSDVFLTIMFRAIKLKTAWRRHHLRNKQSELKSISIPNVVEAQKSPFATNYYGAHLRMETSQLKEKLSSVIP